MRSTASIPDSSVAHSRGGFPNLNASKIAAVYKWSAGNLQVECKIIGAIMSTGCVQQSTGSLQCLQVEYSSTSEFEISDDYRRGLLCQAKIFRRNSTWGSLSRKQKQILRNKLKHFALLLYRYSDQNGDRCKLVPFLWQLAGNATVQELSRWLDSGRFPNLQNSQQILGALLTGHDPIGTDDKKVIDTDIAPPLRPSLVIRIRWKDDGPGGSVHVQQRVSHEIEQQVHVRQY